MSEYLPSFIVEPVLRQARRFSERIGGEEPPTNTTGSSFALPAVPDFQRFYPTRFWNQPPSPAATGSGEAIISAALEHDNAPEEGTWRSIARNIQLWANQINNLDIEDDVIQEPVLESVEQDDHGTTSSRHILTEEPENALSDQALPPFPPLDTTREPASRSLPTLNPVNQPQRTISDTSLNPAHELSFRSQIIERNAQGRSQSDPFAAVNVPEAADAVMQDVVRSDQMGSAYNRTSDGSGMLPEDDGMKPLRQKINAVWAGPGTAQDKSKLVHSLMTERYRSSQKMITPTSSATPTSPPFRATSPLSLSSMKSDEAVFNLFPSDLQPTFAPLGAEDVPDEITGEVIKPDFGCLHYKRNVKMQCAACERWYTCRVCHDEKEDHQLPRRETKHMLCMICNTPQRVSQVCKKCHVQAAYYYCSICKLWNNDSDKSIYHCEDCGICRLGQGLGKDFFHCKTCAACMSIAAEATHRCIERSTKCDCPICGEFMFTSSRPVTFMRCGHSIHETCFSEWCNTSYKCPICSKSIANMESQFRRLDRHIAGQPMPEEFSNNRAYVFCNDCNSRSVVKYHWLGLKCGVCDSYNTAQLELLGPESPAMQERAGQFQEMGIGEAAITASQTQSPSEELASPGLQPNTASTQFTDTSTIIGPSPTTGSGTPRSAIAVPVRRDSPFHNLPHSPTRSARTMSPVVGSYFGTGQRAPSSAENRRGSYFSVLSFGTATEEHNTSSSSGQQPRAPSQSSSAHQRPNSSQLSRSHLSPLPNVNTRDLSTLRRGASPLEDDDDMHFWGGQSPRNHDADIVDADTKVIPEHENSSSDEEEDGEMEYDDDDEGDEEDEDPMDILIGHR